MAETYQQQADRAQTAMVAIQRMQELLGNQVHHWTNRKECPDSTTEQAKQVQVELEALRRLVAFDFSDATWKARDATQPAPRCPVCGRAFVPLTGGATGCPAHGIRGGR